MPGEFLDFRQIRRTILISSVLASRGLLATMQTRGRRLVGPCPIHHGDNPAAFVVDPDRGAWYCFTGCSTGGDVIDLVRRLDHVGYREAAERVARLGAAPAVERSAPNVHRASRFRAYTHALPLRPDIPFLARKGILPSTAEQYEVGRYDGAGWLARCVAVRLHDTSGQPLGYAGRHLHLGDQLRFGKWKVPPGFPKAEVLFGYHRLAPHRGDGVVLVECPWGVLRLAQVGVAAVALLGTQLSSRQLALLAREPVVGIMLDGDHAGRSAALQIRDRIASRTRVYVVDLPADHDPDDLSDDALRAASPQLPR